MERKSFPLKDFYGIEADCLKKLAIVGLRNVKEMLEAGKSKAQREKLAQATGIDEAILLELVKLSDLARLPGVKGIRARLYYEAGVDSIENLARWEPDDLRKMVTEFIARTGFKGIPPLPAEVISTVAHARKLPVVIEY